MVVTGFDELPRVIKEKLWYADEGDFLTTLD